MENKVAPEWMINGLRRRVARDIADVDMPYGACVNALCAMNFFGNWTAWEINNRPVNIDEATEIVGEYLGLY